MPLTKLQSRGTLNIGAGSSNIIINGAMTVSQRGTQTNQTSGYTACDRWQFAENGSVVVTTSQSTDVPSGQGFANSLKIDVTTASGTPSSGNYALVRTKFEGQDLQHLLYGTSNAYSLTLSFWVKSPKTGTHIVQLTHSDAGYYNSIIYTINSANTWEHKKVTFVGYQTTGFDDDINNSLQVYWWLMKYDEGTLTENTWHNTSANQASGQVNTMDNTSNNFYLTGVQLEVGSQNSDFQNEDFGTTLKKCQRYFQSWGSVQSVGSGVWYNSTQIIAHMPFFGIMRDAPTMTTSGNNFAKVYKGGSTTRQVDDSTPFDLIKSTGSRLNLGVSSSGTDGQGAMVQTEGSGAYIFADADL